jgi:hypothetical protein
MNQILNIDKVVEGQFCKKLDNKGLSKTDAWAEKFYFAAYILSELEEDPEKSSFGPLLDLLPKNVDSFPYNYDDEEISFLKGSPFLRVLSVFKE